MHGVAVDIPVHSCGEQTNTFLLGKYIEAEFLGNKKFMFNCSRYYQEFSKVVIEDFQKGETQWKGAPHHQSSGRCKLEPQCHPTITYRNG